MNRFVVPGVVGVLLAFTRCASAGSQNDVRSQILATRCGVVAGGANP